MRGRFHYSHLLLVTPVVVLLAFGNQFLYLSGAEFSDLTISHLPNALFLQKALITWRQIPLWSPTILSGYPFAANPLSGLWYLPGWFSALWPEPWTFNLLAGLHLVWGGAGLFVLLREYGLGQTASIFGGLAFAWMPKLVAHYGAGHITLIYAVAWTPWLFVATHVTHRLRWRYMPGVILALIFFADVRWAAYAGLLWLWYIACSQKYQLLVQLLPAAGLAAPLGFPLLEYTRLSTRAALGAGDVLAFSLPPARLLGLFFPEFGGLQEWVVYPGVVVSFLAVIGLAWPDVRRKTRFWWGALLVTVVFALGEHVPGLAWLANLPGMSLLRVPPRALFIAGMALPVLSAHTLDVLLTVIRAEERRWAIRGMIVLGGGILATVLGIWVLTGTLSLNFAWGAWMAVLTVIVIGILLGKRRPLPDWTAYLLIGISLLDWVGVNVRSLSPRPADLIFSEGVEVAEYLAGQSGSFRVYSPSYSLPQQTAALFGLELADGVDPLQVKSYADFMETATGVPQTGYGVTIPPFAGDVSTTNAGYRPDAGQLGLLNVRYVAADFDLDVEGLVLREQFDATRVYENTLARPRAWMQAGQGEIETIHRTPNWIEVRAAGPGMLVLSEVAYPGWQARVDGQRVEIQMMEGLLRGVELTAGEHEVIFTFHPVSLYLGLSVFALTMIGLLILPRKMQTG